MQSDGMAASRLTGSTEPAARFAAACRATGTDLNSKTDVASKLASAPPTLGS